MIQADKNLKIKKALGELPCGAGYVCPDGIFQGLFLFLGD